MTTTTRRSTRITKPAAAKPRPTYEGVVLARVYSKQTSAFLGYLAKPSKPVSEKGFVFPWYQVTKDASGVWHCKCAATVECKHVIAAKELDAIHEANEAAQESVVACEEEPVLGVASFELISEIAEPVNFEERRQAKAATQHAVHCVCGHDRIVGPIFTEVELAAMTLQKCSECSAIKAPVVLPGLSVKARYDVAPKGDLNGVQRRTGFAEALFGTSPEMARYRQEFEARVAGIAK